MKISRRNTRKRRRSISGKCAKEFAMRRKTGDGDDIVSPKEVDRRACGENQLLDGESKVPDALCKKFN